jgi:hypothetical protein
MRMLLGQSMFFPSWRSLVNGGLFFRGGGPVLPGTGLAKLRVVTGGTMSFFYWYGAQIPNMEFLQSLVCAGYGLGHGYGYGNELGGLQSLAGLGRLADGIGTPGECFVSFTGSGSTLTNVAALATYARCGSINQRPDGDNATRPCLAVPCGQIQVLELPVHLHLHWLLHVRASCVALKGSAAQEAS